MTSFIKIDGKLVNPKAPKSDTAIDTLKTAYEQHETYDEPRADSGSWNHGYLVSPKDCEADAIARIMSTVLSNSEDVRHTYRDAITRLRQAFTQKTVPHHGMVVVFAGLQSRMLTYIRRREIYRLAVKADRVLCNRVGHMVNCWRDCSVE